MSRLFVPIVAVPLAAALAAGCGAGARGGGDGPAPDRAALERTAERIRAAAEAAAVPRPGPERGPVVLRGSIPALDGGRIDLAALRGRVVVLVNTASRCGFTPQYAGLERLWRERRAAGLVVLGVPTADFRQELGSDRAVRRFCALRYGVTFPMAVRARVIGPRAIPLYRAIAARSAPAGGAPGWNFTKYLIDRRGRLAARAAPYMEPRDPAFARAVDALLAEPA